MKYHLTPEEREIEKNAHQLRSVSAEKRRRVEGIIDDRARKNQAISLRLSEFDLEMLKKRAEQEGLPYALSGAKKPPIPGLRSHHSGNKKPPFRAKKATFHEFPRNGFLRFPHDIEYGLLNDNSTEEHRWHERGYGWRGFAGSFATAKLPSSVKDRLPGR